VTAHGRPGQLRTKFNRIVDRLGLWFIGSPLMARMYLLPSLPRFVRPRFEPPLGPWPTTHQPLPTELKTEPGVRRDPGAEESAFRQAPLPLFTMLHSEAIDYALRRGWRHLLANAPSVRRAVRAVNRTKTRTPARTPPTLDAVSLSAQVRARASELGLSTVGFAPYDQKYTFAPYQADWHGPTVIVCMLEQNYEATQRIPSTVASDAADSCYSNLMQRAAKLAGYLTDLGYRAHATTTEGIAVVHHYAVQAGLGQMGINGQLLTPAAGSRCRLSLILTDAPVANDEPRDFGIPKICDACKICVRRCPAGAIPARRTWHRGVEKAVLNEARCLPTIVQSHGCGICMKVCPVQKYGLQPVIDEFTATGRILGKDSDDLEGYDWIDDQHWSPGQRPRLDKSFFHPAGFVFDPTRTAPADSSGGIWRRGVLAVEAEEVSAPKQ
jgi:epoxyqueuosine reductase